MADGTCALPASEVVTALRAAFDGRRDELQALLAEPDGLFRVFGMGFCEGLLHGSAQAAPLLSVARDALEAAKAAAGAH